MSEPTPSPPPGAGSDPRPTVALPRRGLSNAAIAAIGVILAIILFVVLDIRRLGQANRVEHPTGGAVDAFPSPPPLELPPEVPAQLAIVASPAPFSTPAISVRRTVPEPALPPLPVPVMPPPSAPVVDTKTGSTRQDAPAVVYDHGATAGGTAGAQGGGTQTATSSSTEDDAPIGTTVIRNHTTIMPTGTVIPAVLETPIDSTRPGLVRALVSENARGFDGKRVLIPRGSRLIGEYASDVRSGQKRVLVTWTRLIRPDGVAIRIGSPGADALGGAGIPGRVNTYFLQRFGAAVLQSALQVGVNLASRPGSGSVIVGLPSTTGGAIGQDLIPSADLKPRIRVKEGASLTIFVAHDLDFSGTPSVDGGGPP